MIIVFYSKIKIKYFEHIIFLNQNDATIVFESDRGIFCLCQQVFHLIRYWSADRRRQ
jgi:hypothetical protein